MSEYKDEYFIYDQFKHHQKFLRHNYYGKSFPTKSKHILGSIESRQN